MAKIKTMRLSLNFIKIILIIGLVPVLFSNCTRSSDLSKKHFEAIQTGFETPSDTNKVWCYWYWINDDISKEGISKDLEAMKKAGIGAAFIGNINPAGVDGKVPLFSNEWWGMMVHAITEGKRLGVDIGVFNCPGWSQSGGPWIKADMAMRYLTYSETGVKGPGEVRVKLAQPKRDFQDTHTLAFRSPQSTMGDLKKLIERAESDPYISNLSNIFDNDTATAVSFGILEEKDIIIKIKLKRAIQARQVSLTPAEIPFKCDVSLYANVNGEEQLLKEFVFDRSNFSVNVGPVIRGPLAIALPGILSSDFRLVMKNFKGPQKSIGFSEVNISEAPVLDRYMEKQLGKMHPTPTPSFDTYVWPMQVADIPSELIVNSGEIIDLTNQLDENGLLTWEVPDGDWIIMRFGMTPTGTKNSPSAPQGRGYEVDKMNSELARFHFENFVGELIKRIPEDSRSAFKYVIADSYEMGSQNWTDNYEVKFREEFGYDPVIYLPVLSGRIVGSVEESERFLWDLRRSVANDVAYEYVGGLRKISNEHHLKLWLENYGHWGFPSEFLMYGGQSDLVSGEFWNESDLGDIECKASSSAAHIYGKPFTSAEAFTASDKSYLRHPALLKTRGDWSFTEGINHLVLHLYIQQPDDNRVPGMNAWFSTEFNRHNTWFGQADSWIDYLRRCQHMLQQGNYAAEVCYFIGENAPIMTGSRIPEIPRGYSYDYINAEVILNRLSVQDGKFVLPDGMSYRIMVLPPFNTMRPEVLSKIEQLVSQGGIVLGQKPEKSPSLQNYPDADQKVKELASQLWSGQYDNGKMINAYGKGFVLDGQDLTEALDWMKIRKDVDILPDAPVLWTHRTMPGMDIYFLTNQSDEEVEISPLFRVNNKLRPQLWDAVTGEIRYLNQFTLEEDGISLSLTLQPSQSWFVVFTKGTAPGIKKGYSLNFPEPELIQTINGPFTVDFKNKAIGPEQDVVFDELQDWSLSADEKIKYYSGTAIYKTTFNIDSYPENSQYFINLGNVGVMARVKLNGTEVGTTWIAPYRLNISGILQQGTNELEIEVANLWRNRMIKDKTLPIEERYTWTVIDDVKEDEKPHPSGLLKPITLEYIQNPK